MSGGSFVRWLRKARTKNTKHISDMGGSKNTKQQTNVWVAKAEFVWFGSFFRTFRHGFFLEPNNKPFSLQPSTLAGFDLRRFSQRNPRGVFPSFVGHLVLLHSAKAIPRFNQKAPARPPTIAFGTGRGILGTGAQGAKYPQQMA